ncbi:hypothetical protein DFO47_103294 [Arthrobacter sp. AG258]|uniref:hypothetical protein n=1 Tax=Arthrobacter sp. AG258 TaxID=2183899 RepID=UPI00105D979C|nr:hypothetical protein [Arthrobacter sp. AG258]TDT81637.1 hypothetical protein DFO47_103294 [Arthrobacter sp. AG258]
MFASMPKVVSQSGIHFTVQTVETTDEHVLIRVRSAEMRPGRHHTSAVFPAIADEPLTLSDAHGTSTPMIQSSSASGLFLGIVDVAYSLSQGLDLSSPLTLSSANARLTFRI